MGGYPKEYEYPNQAVQMPIQQPLKAVVEHRSPNKIKEFINITGDFFGWGWLLTAVLIGAFVIVSMIFRQYIKKTFGGLIKWLNSIVNKE